jgi:hypothetical protein
MMPDQGKLFCQGSARVVWMTADAVASKPDAEAGVPYKKKNPAGEKRKPCVDQMHTLLNRLAEKGQLRSPDQMNSEGDGIYAVKANCGLRAYGWWSIKYRRYFVISHFILKKWDKLDPADLARAQENRREFDTGVKA